MSTETIRTVRDGETRMSTSTFTQILSSEMWGYMWQYYLRVSVVKLSLTSLTQYHSGPLSKYPACSPTCPSLRRPTAVTSRASYDTASTCQLRLQPSHHTEVTWQLRLQPFHHTEVTWQLRLQPSYHKELTWQLHIISLITQSSRDSYVSNCLIT